MKRQLRGTVAFAVCGSFCTLGAAVAQAEQLVRQGWELLPVMSYAASGLNTRFGRADEWKARLETLTGHRVLDTLQDVEPLGPRQLARALVVAPCTGTTLARLAAGLSAGHAAGKKPAAGRVPGAAGCLYQRWAGGFRGEHCTADAAQALLLCALRTGRCSAETPEPEGGSHPAARCTGGCPARSAAAAGASGVELRVSLFRGIKMWYTIS